MEELIGFHSKRIRSFHSSQATPRKVGKAKEYALMVAKAMGKKKLKERARLKVNKRSRKESRKRIRKRH